MKQLILAFIIIFNLNIALSETSKDSLSKDILNVTIVGEYNKQLFDSFSYSFGYGLGIGLELEFHISSNSAFTLIFQNQNWSESDALNNTYTLYDKKVHKGENQKLALSYTYKYNKSNISQIFFSLGPSINDYDGVYENYQDRDYVDSKFIGFNNIGADFSIMVRNKLNNNLYYNIGGRLNLMTFDKMIYNFGAFISITYKLI